MLEAKRKVPYYFAMWSRRTDLITFRRILVGGLGLQTCSLIEAKPVCNLEEARPCKSVLNALWTR